MNIDLTEEQVERIALNWIRRTDSYKTIIDTMFSYNCTSKWSWVDALRYAVKICGNNYCSDKKWIIEELSR